MPRKTLIVSVPLIVFLFTVFVFLPFYHTVPRKTTPFFVRVRLLDQVQGFSLGSKEKLSVYDADSGTLLREGISLLPGSPVRYGRGFIRLGNENFSRGELKLVPSGGNPVFVDKHRYRGEIYVIREEAGLSVINRVEIEDYLKGVLPKEVYIFWPMSALETQAIAARSFAVFEALRRGKRSTILRRIPIPRYTRENPLKITGRI